MNEASEEGLEESAFGDPPTVGSAFSYSASLEVRTSASLREDKYSLTRTGNN